MSRAAKLTFGASAIFTTATCLFVHFDQERRKKVQFFVVHVHLHF